MPKRTDETTVAARALMHDERFATAAHAFMQDPDFVPAFNQLDLKKLSDSFDDFDENVAVYNTYHRLERRLWSLKLGKGSISAELEKHLQGGVPKARKAFHAAFAGIDRCLSVFESAGFDKVLDRHLPTFMAMLGTDHHPLRSMVDQHLAAAGCSPTMLAEGHRSLTDARYDVLGHLGQGKTSGLRKALAESVKAHDEIFAHTEANGLKYLRGRCGPPSWAVAVTEVLAYFGITVSAWWVVAAVVVVVSILIALCVTKSLPSSILSKCQYLSLKLNFTF